mmetsp:Transcript_19997/g.56184  ORF Transcript_19997/g.56184 Transcript_19997/m.56184 type:complete len:162 (+) Transcript_19997:61-546(+)|eukprot:CAMPEP_0119146568 /NCGR_PEP_ID=MMETSP1310-20130426/39109_1 /TAXON_ID=464262 /ORGANISM="Genus nov. species nov., Strain RCC2339" /LENGTH=161 /DNA_ID=CAMNT_0007138477 /DNA_START=58 /DNA_END=543 /DNA_ORIENTATION=-
MSEVDKVGILMVCLGNICRSPMAWVYMDDMLRREGLENVVFVESCGTGSHFEGNGAHPEGIRTAAKHKLDLSGHVARGIRKRDFERFDYIVAMNRENLDDLQSLCPAQHQHKLSLLLSHSESANGVVDVPDPYYGEGSFEDVYRLVSGGCDGLLKAIRTKL